MTDPTYDLGDAPVGTPPTEAQMAQMRKALGLGVIRLTGSCNVDYTHVGRVVDLRGYNLTLAGSIESPDHSFATGTIHVTNTGASAQILHSTLMVAADGSAIGTSTTLATGGAVLICVSGNVIPRFTLATKLAPTQLQVGASVSTFLGSTSSYGMRTALYLGSRGWTIEYNSSGHTPAVIAAGIQTSVADSGSFRAQKLVIRLYGTCLRLDTGYTIAQIIQAIVTYFQYPVSDLPTATRLIFVNDTAAAITIGDPRVIETATYRVIFPAISDTLPPDCALAVDVTYGYTTHWIFSLISTTDVPYVSA